MKTNGTRLFLLICIMLLNMTIISCEGNTGDNYDLYIYNNRSEIRDVLQSVVNTYSEETGQKVKVYTPENNPDSTEPLREELESANAPAIFYIRSNGELAAWLQKGFVMDLGGATNEEFKAMHNNLPDTLRLSTDGNNSFGIPYDVVGYGFIADKDMIGELFGRDQTESFISDFQNASYEEFQALVRALDGYINNGTPATIRLAGNVYTTALDKAIRPSHLTGVFAVSGAEAWTYGEHLLNISLNTVFDSPSAAIGAGEAEIEALRGSFVAYARLLELMTSHASGREGAQERGPEFISEASADTASAIDLFANNRAVFIMQGNWIYKDIERANADMIDTLTILPVKMPFGEEDIRTEGQNPGQINKSIPVYATNYFAINEKAPEEQKEKAQQFLTWLYATEKGRGFITGDMKYTPFTADPGASSAGNSLNRSVSAYLKAGNALSNVYATSPPGWSESMGDYIKQNYLTKKDWSEADPIAIAEYAVSRWREMN